jgi:hypothetical protein
MGLVGTGWDDDSRNTRQNRTCWHSTSPEGRRLARSLPEGRRFKSYPRHHLRRSEPVPRGRLSPSLARLPTESGNRVAGLLTKNPKWWSSRPIECHPVSSSPVLSRVRHIDGGVLSGREPDVLVTPHCSFCGGRSRRARSRSALVPAPTSFIVRIRSARNQSRTRSTPRSPAAH